MPAFTHYLPSLPFAVLLPPSPVRGQAVPTIATPDRVRSAAPFPAAQLPRPDGCALYAGGELIYAGDIGVNHVARQTGTNRSWPGNGNINGIGERVGAIVASRVSSPDHAGRPEARGSQRVCTLRIVTTIVRTEQ